MPNFRSVQAPVADQADVRRRMDHSTKMPNSFPEEHVFKISEKENVIHKQDIESNVSGRSDSSTTLFMKLLSAFLYFSISFLITVVNKVALTSYNFPSFQLVCSFQLVTTVVVLGAAKNYGYIKFPSMERNTFSQLHPLPFLFLGNAMTGLGGTQLVSLPMHTCLRRFAVLLTMVAEIYILSIVPTCAVQTAVYMMIVGAIVAALKDLTFNAQGYTLVFLNNILTATNAVYIKKKLNVTDFGYYGLMYYCSLFMVVPQLLITYLMGDFYKSYNYDGWGNPYFLCNFILACVLGVALNTTMCMCTQYNSALTTQVVGTLKNIFVTYLGMFIGGDYKFEWTNFIGINISVLGSLIYSYVTFKPQRKTTCAQSGKCIQK